jgi:hypothetical protein
MGWLYGTEYVKTETRTKRTRMPSSAFLALAIQLSILGAMVGLSYSFFSAVSLPFQNALAQTENREQVVSNNTAAKT